MDVDGYDCKNKIHVLIIAALTAAKARQTRTRRTPKPSANPISPLIACGKAASPVDKLDKYFAELDLPFYHSQLWMNSHLLWFQVLQGMLLLWLQLLLVLLLLKDEDNLWLSSSVESTSLSLLHHCSYRLLFQIQRSSCMVIDLLVEW